MQVENPKKKRCITDPVHARVVMIDGNFTLPAEHREAMSKVRAIIARAAQDIEATFQPFRKPRDAPPNVRDRCDIGYLLNGLRELQNSKDTLCQSLIIVHAEEDVPEQEESKNL